MAFSRILPLFKGTDCFSLHCGIFPYSYSPRRWVWWDSCSLLPSVSAVAKKTVTKPHIQKHWTGEEIHSSFHWVVQQTAHRGDGGTHCRQSNKTMIWAMRSSAPTTKDSDAKHLLTYLNCYPAHERAATFPCTNLTMKDNIADHFPSKPTWTASNSQLFLAEVPSASSLHEHTQMHSASLGENQAWQNAF